jgi:hypothetical protein
MMAAMSIDMFIDPAEDPRTDPPGQGSELATLTGSWTGTARRWS